jgi:hypothetical protein
MLQLNAVPKKSIAAIRSRGKQPPNAAAHSGTLEREVKRVYCPKCLVEYRDGFAECSDCHVPLLAGTAPETPAPFDPTIDLVVVLETNDGIHLAMAKGLLEDAGIPFFLLGQIASLVQDVDGFLHKWVRVQVPRDREAEARELLEELLQPVASAEDGVGAEDPR